MLLLVGAAAGCSSAKEMFGASTTHVPEGAGVADAPYPSLADAPQHVPPIGERDGSQGLLERKRGAALVKDLKNEADRLRAETRRLDRQKSGDRVVATRSQRAAAALAEEQAELKKGQADEAAKLRAEIEAELKAAFGEDAEAAAQ